MKNIIYLLLFCYSTALLSASDDFLILSKSPNEVSTLYNDSKMIDLAKARALCNYLTDNDVSLSTNGYPYPKRKKAYKRHIKQLCEKLEFSAWSETPLTQDEINNLYKLNLFKKSMNSKAKSDALGLTIKQKIMMVLNSTVRKNDFAFKNKITKKEAMNLNLEKPIKTYSVNELSLVDPKDSPYYSNLQSNETPYKRFSKLAKKKKIKNNKEQMVLIFDGVSGSGSAPKVKTIDKNLDDGWSVKWGDEIHTDAVGSRIFAALGFDVDHPYYKEKNEVIVVFPSSTSDGPKNGTDMVLEVYKNFNINIEKFVSKTGLINEEMISKNKDLAPYLGNEYITFVECAIEARPDRVKRLGPIMTNSLYNRNRRELRGSLLAHLWIDNWDTRAENTLTSNNHLGKRVYEMRGSFSDLGTSLGVSVGYLPSDFRVGLINKFSWDILKKRTRGDIGFKGKINAFLKPYESATYADMKWMAYKIANLSANDLEKILDKSGWPKGIKNLYFHKLANRRAQILKGFNIKDPHNIEFDRNYTYSKKGELFINNGVLIKDYNKDKHPLGYLSTKGRLRNYGQGPLEGATK